MNWCQENEKLVKTSHPNLSAVTEDIRFNLQPVSISKFTSCPKHCIHRGGACQIGEKRKKKNPLYKQFTDILCLKIIFK